MKYFLTLLSALIFVNIGYAQFKPLKRDPVTFANVCFFKSDYDVLKKAFDNAKVSTGISDGCAAGQIKVVLDAEHGNVLLLTLHNALQGVMTKKERDDFLKKQEEYFKNH